MRVGFNSIKSIKFEEESLNNRNKNSETEYITLNFTNVIVESPRIKRIVKKETLDIEPIALFYPEDLNDKQSLNLSFNSLFSSIEKTRKKQSHKRSNSYDLESKKLITRISKPAESVALATSNKPADKAPLFKKMQTDKGLVKLSIDSQSNFKGSIAASDFFKIEEEYENTEAIELLETYYINTTSDNRHYRNTDVQDKLDDYDDEQWINTDFDFMTDEKIRPKYKPLNYYHNNDIKKLNCQNKLWVEKNKDKLGNLTLIDECLSSELDMTKKFNLSKEEGQFYFQRLAKLVFIRQLN